MIDLSAFSKATQPEEILAVIVGTHGIGKTTMAAHAPGAVIVPIEDGVTDRMPCLVSPQVKTYAELVEVLTFIYQGEHQFKSVVIDSLDWLETNIVWPEVCARNNWENIEQPGFGKGYIEAVTTVWPEILGMLSAIWRERRLNVICLAHEKVIAHRPPDSEPYDRYVMKLQDRAAKLVEEWAWLVGFMKFETAIAQSKKDSFGTTEVHTRGVGTGNRILHVEERPAYRAKNRYDLPSEIHIPNDPAQSWDTLDAAVRGARPQ